MVTMSELKELMKEGKLTAWMPEGGPQTQAAAVIAAPPGQKLDLNLYRTYLGNRVALLVNEEEDAQGALDYLTEVLKGSQLLADEISPTLQNMANTVIVDNPEIQAKLEASGATIDLPEEMKQDRQAERMFLETGLESWLAAIQQ